VAGPVITDTAKAKMATTNRRRRNLGPTAPNTGRGRSVATSAILKRSVHGHEKVRTYGHKRSALMATKSPQFWPREVRTPH
jgi:hypothetical protein